MKFARLLLPVLGLMCIALYYVFQITILLLAAVALFVIGAFFMRSPGRQGKRNDKQQRKEKAPR